MRVRCECGWEKEVKDELYGKRAECPRCKNAVVLKPYEQVVITTPITATPATPIAKPVEGVIAKPQRVAVEPTSIHVEVAAPSPMAHSLGIASVILGILAILICWIPIFGMFGLPLSGLGIVLGIVGFMIAVARKGVGIGFPIAGSAICGLAIAICVTLNFFIFAAANAAVEGIAKANEIQRPILNDGEIPDLNIIEVPEKPEDPEKAANPFGRVQPKPVGKVFEDDLVRVSVASTGVGKVELLNLGRKSASADELLKIKISVFNKSDSKKLNYRSWGASSTSFGTDGQATLKDDLGNLYKAIHFGFGTEPVGQVKSDSIYPNKELTDLLVFETPVSKAKHLILSLPLSAYGADGDGSVQIDLTPPAVVASEPEKMPPVRAEPVGTFKPPTETPKPEKPAVPEQDLEKIAARKLGLTKAAAAKNPDVLPRRLKELIDEFPDTIAAKEAAEMLEKLEKK